MVSNSKEPFLITAGLMALGVVILCIAFYAMIHQLQDLINPLIFVFVGVAILVFSIARKEWNPVNTTQFDLLGDRLIMKRYFGGVMQIPYDEIREVAVESYERSTLVNIMSPRNKEVYFDFILKTRSEKRILMFSAAEFSCPERTALEIAYCINQLVK